MGGAKARELTTKEMLAAIGVEVRNTPACGNSERELFHGERSLGFYKAIDASAALADGSLARKIAENA
ncbi:hypothetical protein [Consotaella salsifontis]|uniref:Uncharacterized protein n=1 Tax=Consotaella salsifontis TaxID=1365950 RepID=A0A1T4SSF6_9HYPH|nr:hypothetical protein [Consotaella salsifontis]SKA31103.1 hypothetical protein SAMN05428963_113117 [Consotaella salsifontis]